MSRQPGMESGRWRKKAFKNCSRMSWSERPTILSRLGRSIANLNLFQTDTTDESTIYIHRLSTRVYICVLFFSMAVLLVQNVSQVGIRVIEVKNPSLDSYLSLYDLYSDVNCPCSQISTLYGSFVRLIPIYHPICSSEFISQTWIEMLFDNMTAFRFLADFRAIASTQFQVLRALCHFSQNALSNNIGSFSQNEFISGALLNENRWNIEIGATIEAFLDRSVTNAKHIVSFLRSIVTFNLLVSGIETSVLLLMEIENDTVIAEPNRIFYESDIKGGYCACDDHGDCYLPSRFYNVTSFDNDVYIDYSTLESDILVTLKNWFTGCWAIESLLRSSFRDSFLDNQTALDLIGSYFNWSSPWAIPTALNLTELNKTNGSGETFDDLLKILFLETTVVERNYSVYFEQCQALSCFYSIKQHASALYIVTSLLALYGGLSTFLRFLIPQLVAYMVRRFRRRIELPAISGEFEPRWCTVERCVILDRIVEDYFIYTNADVWLSIY